MAKTIRKRSRKSTPSTGWLTSDDDEIERRRARGATEAFQIDPPLRTSRFFGTFWVESVDGQSYRVEVRSLTKPINSCDCPDQRINGLGTCKHIEAVLLRLQHRRKRAFREAAVKGSPHVEIFLDRRNQSIRILWPAGSRRRSKIKDLLTPFFTSDSILSGDTLDTLPALQRAINTSSAAIRRRVKTSGELNVWLGTLDKRQEQIRGRRHFETEVAAGKTSLELVKHPLYPYQQEGMLHLAFTGRALLADEMGLGKTVQAIAACELLRRTSGVQRVMVIAPASLKGEWEDQIAKFTDLPSIIIQGSRANRLRQYQQPGFFFLANYEQIRLDAQEINTLLAPEVIVLDEAQRIKNWQTKTAISIKRLQSHYAFVLTGTPVENRIDEIYSIVQFLDPHIFGPLFRFNRDFYQLDEKGRAIGYRNLDQLHKRLRPIMLRRRKEDVEGQLPGLTVNTYFVPMHKEQTLRYEEYETKLARLAAIARKRSLTKEEMERLQRYLACMRMLCDTPYILDRGCRISPKLQELRNLLQEIVEDGDHKIIIFSEWERMLQLVRDQAEDMGLGYAWHTGKVPQPKRRAEIRRFKDDPCCRLFLSTDSGSLGLNLQAADVVINLDMPWNPARLDQRIARAWRKHQKRPVQVINLVSEHSIEHRMLTLLEQKRTLAEGVVDGRGAKEMRLPSGRAAFLERVDVLMPTETAATPPTPTDPLQQLLGDVLSLWGNRLEVVELYGSGSRQTLLVVADRSDDDLRRVLSQQLQERFRHQPPRLRLMDRDAYATMQELLTDGILSSTQESARILYQVPERAKPGDDEQTKRLMEARKMLALSERNRRMATVLSEGGFATEALAPMREAVDTVLQALALWQGHKIEGSLAPGQIDSVLIQANLLPRDALSLLILLRDSPPTQDEAQAGKLFADCDDLISQAILTLATANGNHSLGNSSQG